MNSFADLYEAVKQKLDLTETAMKLWIEPIQPLKMNHNKVILYVKSPYGRQIVAENYTLMFEKHFRDVLGFEVKVEFVSEEDVTLTHEQKIKLDPITELQDDKAMVNKLEKAVTGSIYTHTFDTFIVGESNKLAFSACKAAAQGSSVAYNNPIYIYSEPGLGKTHLLSAVNHELKNNRPELNVIYVNAETFVTEFVESVKYHTVDGFKRKYRSADVLLIDDVQFISRAKESQIELFHTFDILHMNGKQIILASDRPPKEIAQLEDRMRTRFERGLMADISIPEFETRLAIIKRKAELLDLEIPANVMEFIAERLKNNIRQLEGAILKMNALKVVTEFPPNIQMAQNVIRDVLTDQQPIPVTVEKIINEVAAIYNVTNDDMRSQSRSAQISTARQVAIYVISKTTSLSYTAIGQEFGGRDHSTIVYAINKVKNIIKKDNSYRASIEDIIKNMGSTS
ncbi:MAG: chromosomal replication initiator protein DnaA [Oscillospiraceae bacterium]|jgi:chromosomal replication initiator protein|nr:chromosomal replication initiator protein DnaA [Oscillospiraceae bacterium]